VWTLTIRVVLVDDHAVVRQGLKMYLGLDPGIEVVGEAANGREAVARARELGPDVVLMDLLMPVLDGVAATAPIASEQPGVAVVALTSALDHERVVGAIRAGAVGYLLKDASADDLCRAIQAAAAGQVQLSPEAARALVREPPAPPPAAQLLTDRERQVLVLLARGLANKEIGRALGVGEQTVKSHVSSLLAKLGVQSRTQAALRATQIGLIGDPLAPAAP
jgi:NarL family two-component system response regulator LiaR